MSRKICLIIVFTMLALTGTLALVSCDFSPSQNSYSLEFIVDGEVYKTISDNTSLSVPVAPIKDGYTFDGWYYDDGVWQEPFDVDVLTETGLTKDISVYAKWMDNSDICLQYSLADGGKQYIVSGVISKNVTEVIIPAYHKGLPVISIGAMAFNNCHNLINITIPDSITTICEHAFSACTNLTSITIGNNVTLIGDSAFMECYNLQSIVIPDSVITISDNAFFDCQRLASVTIGNNVISIGDHAFMYCYGITTITIPNSVTFIGYDAFFGCESLTKVTIGNGVTSIGDGTFLNCESLTKVNYTGTIDQWAMIEFGGPSANPIYHTKNLYIDDVEVAEVKLTTATKIGSYAFCHADWNSITIPDSVTTINSHAFFDWYNLTSITIPNSVSTIGEGTFTNCYGLVSITLGNNVEVIADDAFVACYKLVEIYNLSNTLTITPGSKDNGYVGYCAKDVYTSISEESKLTTTDNGFIFYQDDDECYLMGYVGSPTNLVLPSDEKWGSYSIYDYAFQFCDNLTTISFSDSVTSIGDYAFSGCTGLTSIIIPDSITSIGDLAFYNCASLTTVYYGGTVEQWNSISKGSSWDSGAGEYTISCVDGIIAKDGTITYN